jgi:hypothetical protein
MTSRFLAALRNPSSPVLETMERSVPVQHRIDIVRTDVARREVFGWAYQTRTPSGEIIVDRKNAYAETEVLEDAAYDYVLSCRSMGAEHMKRDGAIPGTAPEYLKFGRLIESFMVTRAKCEAMGIPAGTMPEGWWVGFYVDDNDVWAMVERGDVLDLSIAGVAMSTYDEDAT